MIYKDGGSNPRTFFSLEVVNADNCTFCYNYHNVLRPGSKPSSFAYVKTDMISVS